MSLMEMERDNSLHYMVERKIQPLRLNIAWCVGGECNLKWSSLSSPLVSTYQ